MKAEVLDKYQPVIGLEIHAQLLTQTKIYSSDPVTFGKNPNTQVNVISLAYPGTLPKLNKKVLEYAVKMGLACHCEISRYQVFDRKNYFYPDLPKGYQLTQDRTPACKNGYITIRLAGEEINIRLNRIHIEEDAGKLVHDGSETESLVDYNRAGVPLIEIVTEPVIRSAEEAGVLLAEVQRMIRYLSIGDGNMEEGSLRCDANISVRKKEESALGKKVEVKNMNSIRNLQRAIEFEIERQAMELENGVPITSETRLFDADSGSTRSMRTKEELNDYRYFPDPDLSPVEVTAEWLEQIRKSMPVMPRELAEKFITHYGLPAYDAEVLTDSREVAVYFDEVCRHTGNYKAASNWVMGPVKGYLNEHQLDVNQFPVSPKSLADLIQMIDDRLVSHTVASQTLFPELLKGTSMIPIELARQLNVIQESSEDSILPIVEEVLESFPAKVKEYRSGKKGIISMFMGEVMKKSKGKADPRKANELLLKKLNT